MIVTTTNSIEGREVAEYLRVVSGETIAGINMFKDIGAGFRNLVGGRSKSYEGEVTRARETAIGEMVQRTSELGAHAIIGVDLDYENLGQGGMMMVCASGTAVTLR